MRTTSETRLPASVTLLTYSWQLVHPTERLLAAPRARKKLRLVTAQPIQLVTLPITARGLRSKVSPSPSSHRWIQSREVSLPAWYHMCSSEPDLELLLFGDEA